MVMSLRDRQWRESQPSWGCPHVTQILCVTPLNTHTPPPVYSIPILLQTPFPSPFSPRPPAPPDNQGTLIILFPIINLCCLHTMGPKESCRQQRKHLLLSRQGTNSRIPESVSYIAPVKNTYARTYSMYAHVQTITSSDISSL